MIFLLNMLPAEDFYQFHDHWERIYDGKPGAAKMAKYLTRHSLPADQRAHEHIGVNDGTQGLTLASSFDIFGNFFVAEILV